MVAISLRDVSLSIGSDDPGVDLASDGDTAARLLRGSVVEIELPLVPVAFYRHGWQSWSLTCWHDPADRVPVQRPAILHPMQTDPSHVHRTDAVGSWVGAVRFDDGQVLLLGALGTDAQVELTNGCLRGTSGAGERRWLLALGSETEVFRRYADELARELGKRPGRPAPTIWCSWYSLYTGITEDAIAAVVADTVGLPFDTIQIDDGWQRAVGDWQANGKFPSGMGQLANRIHDAGRKAGIWLAPLIAVASSQLVREHPDWLLRDGRYRPVSAGFNWSAQLYALDTSRPAVLTWLEELLRTVVSWGFDYLKLDFLYGGALPGVRANDLPRETAYRHGLEAMRRGMGDAYLLACGAPIVPSLGICDAIRIGPDVAGHWEHRRDERLLANPSIPGTRSAVRTSVHRLWLAPAVAIDPDVVYLSDTGNHMNAQQRGLLENLARICGFVATSDLPGWLDAGARETLRRLAAADPDPGRVRPLTAGPYVFEVDGETVDFGPAMGLPGSRGIVDRIAGTLTGCLGNRRLALRIMDALGRRGAERLVRSYLASRAASASSLR